MVPYGEKNDGGMGVGLKIGIKLCELNLKVCQTEMEKSKIDQGIDISEIMRRILRSPSFMKKSKTSFERNL